MKHKIVLSQETPDTFSITTSNGFRAVDAPIEVLEKVAQAYATTDYDIDLETNTPELEEAFIRLMGLCGAAEYKEAPVPILNYLENLRAVDRYDVHGMKGFGKGHNVVFLGAGPSLDQHAGQAFESNCFVVAAGSAISYCVRNNLKPDACLAIDPNEAEVERFKSIPKEWNDVPLLYKGRLHPECLKNWPGHKVWVPGTGDLGTATWEGAQSEFSGGGIGVSTWFLNMVDFFGFDSIYMVGVDLQSDDQGNRYPESLQDLEEAPQEQRDQLFAAERLQLSAIAKGLRASVKTLSTKIAGVEVVPHIPQANSKPKAPLKHFNRAYWRRIRKGAQKILQSIETVENTQYVTEAQLNALPVVNYLLRPQLSTLISKSIVLQLPLETAVFLKTCDKIKPLIKKLT